MYITFLFFFIESHLNFLCELLSGLKSSSRASLSLRLHSLSFPSVIHARLRFIASEWRLPPPCLYNLKCPCPMPVLLNKCLLVFCSQRLRTLSNSSNLKVSSVLRCDWILNLWLIELLLYASDLDVKHSKFCLGRTGAMLMLFLGDLTSAVLNFVAFLRRGKGGQWTGITSWWRLLCQAGRISLWQIKFYVLSVVAEMKSQRKLISHRSGSPWKFP